MPVLIVVLHAKSFFFITSSVLYNKIATIHYCLFSVALILITGVLHANLLKQIFLLHSFFSYSHLSLFSPVFKLLPNQLVYKFRFILSSEALSCQQINCAKSTSRLSSYGIINPLLFMLSTTFLPVKRLVNYQLPISSTFYLYFATL